MGNTFFKKKDIHKFEWVSGADDRKNILDLIVVQQQERNKLLVVNVFRGAEGGIVDHHLVIAKIRCMIEDKAEYKCGREDWNKMQSFRADEQLGVRLNT